MGRLRQYDSRLRGTEQSLVSGLRELRGLCAALEVPESLREAAAYRFRQAAKADLLKGRSVDAIAAASVLVAARRQEFPLTVAQLADHSPIDGDAITHSYTVLVREFSLKLLPPHPRDHLPRLASALSLSADLQREASELLERVDESGFHVGKRPTAVAAAICYTVAAHNGEELTQSTVADVADVAVVTISRHHQHLSALLTEEGEES